MTEVRQHTLAHARAWRGARAAAMVLHPAEAETGIWFARRDVAPDRWLVPAHWEAVTATEPVIVLANRQRVTVRGAPTLLAALRVAGIDNALIELGGPEVPARPADFLSYLDTLAGAGHRTQPLPRKALRIDRRVEVREGAGRATLVPADDFRMHLTLGDDAALTATLRSDLTEPLGRDPGNGVRPRLRLDALGALPPALQGPMLELLGQLALAGAPLIGHFHGHDSGPGLHQTLLRALMTRKTASYLTVDYHRANSGAAGAGRAPSVAVPDGDTGDGR